MNPVGGIDYLLRDGVFVAWLFSVYVSVERQKRVSQRR